MKKQINNKKHDASDKPLGKADVSGTEEPWNVSTAASESCECSFVNPNRTLATSTSVSDIGTWNKAHSY